MTAKLAVGAARVLACVAAVVAAWGPAAKAEELLVARAALVLPMAEAGDDRPAVATAISVAGDGAVIAAGGDDHRIRVWDARSGEEVALLSGHDDWVRGLRVAPSGERLASVANDGALRLWDLNAGVAATTTSRPALRLGPGPLTSVAFHPDGRRLLTVGFRTPLRVFDLQQAKVEATYRCPCVDTRCVAVSRDGRWAAAAGRDGRLRVWDLATRQANPDVPADTQRIYAVAFAPDSQTVATAGDGRVIRFWSAEEGELLAELPTGGTKVRSLAFLNSEQIAVGGVDNSISVWNITSRVATRRLVGHTGAVAALACDDSGRLLASASYDTTVRVWRLGDPPAEETAALDDADSLR